MKTSKEFFERLATDEAFVKEVNDAIAGKREASLIGLSTVASVTVSVATAAKLFG